MPIPYLPNGIRRNNTTIRETDGIVVCTLHNTAIATWNKWAGTCHLYTGGWNTPTTIRRMNECLHHWGFQARVCKGDFIDNDRMLITSAAGVSPDNVQA